MIMSNDIIHIANVYSKDCSSSMVRKSKVKEIRSQTQRKISTHLFHPNLWQQVLGVVVSWKGACGVLSINFTVLFNYWHEVP